MDMMIDAMNAMQERAINIRIVGLRRFRLRLACARALFSLAARMCGFGTITIETDEPIGGGV